MPKTFLRFAFGLVLLILSLRPALAIAPGNVSSGLDLWFNAGSTTSTTTDGVGVSSWGDLSVNNTDAAQATSGSRPLFYSGTHANAINFNPTLLFDGTDDFMTHDDSFLGTGASSKTFIYVGYLNATPSTGTDVFYSYGNNTNGQKFSLDTSSTSLRLFGQGNQLLATGGTFTATVPFIGIGRFFNNLTASMDYNGLPGTNATGAMSINNASFDGYIGATAGGGNNLAGRISEVMIYDSDLGSENKQKIQSYLALKYGITLEGLQGRGEVLNAVNDNSGGISSPSPNFNYGQTFTATVTGTVESLILSGAVSGSPVVVNLYLCNGAVDANACEASPDNSTLAYSVPNFSGSSEYEIPLTTPFNVTSGSTYSFSFEPLSGGVLSFGFSTGNPYAGGAKYNANNIQATEDIYFRLMSSTESMSGTPDYMASDGTTKMWDASLNTSYNFDISGIGQDDDSALDQTKSKSVNTDAILTLSSASSQDNLDFLVAGDNNGAATFTTTGAPAGYGILNRKWLAQEAGEIGTATYAFDVADATFDVPAKGVYYIVYDSDLDSSLADETVAQLYDDGTNGDSVAADSVYSLGSLDLENNMIFTLAGVYTPISGRLYSDQGITPITTADQTIRLLKNGVDTGLTDVTDGSGDYEIDMDAATVAADDILTLFVDNETANGATVVRATGANTHTGIDIYQNYVILRSETATALSNTDLDTANSGDTDITALYSNGTTTTLTGASNARFLVWTGDTYTPGGAVTTSTSSGSFYVYGTVLGSTNTISVGGDFFVDNAATFTHTGTLTLAGGSATTFNQGDDPILSNVNVTNTATLGAKVVTNPANFANLTIAASGRFYLAGMPLTMSGAFSNAGTLMLYGDETITGLTQDTDSGTWNFVGNPNASVDTYTITDFGATDYFNLTIGNTTVPTDVTDVFQQSSNLVMGGSYTISRGIYNTQNFNLNTATSFSASSGSLTFNAGSSNITIGTTFTLSGSSSGVNVFNAGSGTLSIGTTFTQSGTSPVSTTFNAGSGPINVGTTFSASGTGVVFNGSTGAIDIGSTFTVNTAGTVFVAPSTTLTVGTTFAHTNGTFTSNGGTVILDPNTNHSITGIATSFHNLTLLDTNNNATDTVLTFPATISTTITGILNVDGLDTDDRVNIISSSGGSAATTIFSGTGYYSGDFIDVLDNTVTDSSSAESLPINPPNSVNSGNATGWFGNSVVVEFSSATAASTNEATANNFPVLLVSGTLISSSTIDVDITGGTATGGGTDYTMSDPLTVTIPAGTYDGTLGTAVTITVPTLVQDAIIEGDETITYALTNPGTDVTVDDANNDATTQSSHTYTITDDDTGISIEFSAATASSSNETTANNFPLLLINGILASSSTIDVDITGGTATGGGTDYTMTDPLTVTIPAGTYDGTLGTAVSITVPTLVQDSIVEGNETITFSLINVGAGLALGDANSDTTSQSTHTYTITDDDTLLVEFTVTSSSNSEGTTSPTITLTVGGAEITSPVTVEVANAGTGSATSGGTDFTFASPVTITIPAGNYTTPSTVNLTGLTIIDDAIVEGSEDIDFTLQNPSGVTIGDADGNATTEGTHEYTITNNDTLLVEFTVTSSSNSEGTTSPTITLTVGGAEITSPVTVEVANAGTGSATSGGTDFTFTSPVTITIPAGNYTTPSTVNLTGLTIIDDSIVEGSEDIDFTLQNAVGVTIGDADGNATTESTHEYTITNNDTLLVEFTVTSSSNSEGTTSPTITLTVGGAEITSPVTVEVANAGTGSATSGGTDFTFASPVTITIPAGNYTTPSTVNLTGLTIIDDAIVEGSEDIDFTLQNASGVTIGDADGNATTESTHEYTITNNDTLLVEFTVTSSSGSEGVTSPTITLTVGGAEITSPVTVEVANTGTGSATSGGTDFTFTSPVTITIPAGNYTTPSTVNLTGLTIIDDAIVEGSEDIDFTLQNASGVTIGDADGNATTESTHEYTITNNDNSVIVELSSASASSTNEATANNFPTLLVSGTLLSSSTIQIDTTGGSATAGGTDFTTTDPLTITIPAGIYDGTTATDIVFTVPTLVQDSLVEGNETITFGLVNPGTDVSLGDANSDTTSQSTHTYSITDDDTLLVEFTVTSSSNSEGTTSPTITLTVGGAEITSPVTVEVANAGTGSAISGGTDFTFASPVTITIPAGNYTTPSTVNLTGLTIIDDAIVEGSEDIDFTLQNPSGVTIGDADGNATTEGTHEYTITNNDTLLVEFTVTSSSGSEGTTSPTITLTVGGAEITSSVTVEVANAGTGSATAGSTDFTFASPVTITIPAGNYTTPSTVNLTGLTIIDDAIVEGSEDIDFTLQNASGVTIGDADGNATTENTHEYTISNNDTLLVEFTVTSSSNSEGTTSPTITLTVGEAEITSPVTVEVANAGTGSATSGGTDFTFASPVTITIPAGNYTTPSTVNLTGLTIIDDAIVEGSEDIDFTLQNAVGVTIGDADGNATSETTHEVTITNNDTLLVEFTTQSPSASESIASPVWTLTVGGAEITSPVTVEVANAGTGSATSGGTDFTFASPVIITIPVGNYSTPSTIVITGLSLAEDIFSEPGGETIDFTLQNTSGVTIGDADGNATNESTAIFTIVDNDSPAVLITESAGSSSITEGGSTDTYTIALATVPAFQVDIALSAGADCTVSPSGPLSFTTTTAQTVTVTAVDDSNLEGTHSCTITHSATSADTDYNSIVIADVNASITDNDLGDFLVTYTPLILTELGATDTFTVELTAQPSTAVVLNLVSSDTNSATISPTPLTFTDLDWNVPQTVTITPVGDSNNLIDTPTITISVNDASSNNSFDSAADQILALTIYDLDDEDGDGVLDSVEDLGFNGGDGNGDNIQDYTQSEVSGAYNSATNEYTTLAVTAGDCVFIRENDFLLESELAAQDSSFYYPVGLVDFKIICPSNGEFATVKLYYSRVHDTSDWVYKKYNSTSGEYSDFSNPVTISEESVEGILVTTVTFTVTDGDPDTDEDGAIQNAEINDPSGPAVLNPAPSPSPSGGGGGGGGRRSDEEVVKDLEPLTLSSCVFPDTLTHWANGFIEELCEESIVQGYPEGLFGPDTSINRAEMVKIIVRALDLDLSSDFNPFNDLDSGSWYENYVLTAYENGLITGYPDGSFKPGAAITRAEALSILFKAASLKGVNFDFDIESSPFDDVDLDSWYTSYVILAEEMDWVNGYEDDSFRPDQSISRAEMSKVIFESFTEFEWIDFYEGSEIYTQ